MRTSIDQYKLSSGKIIAVRLSEQPPKDSTIWNGYDYTNQFWVHNGERDTRTLEELEIAMNI